MNMNGPIIALLFVSALLVVVLVLRVVLQILHQAPDETLIAIQNACLTLFVGTVVLERTKKNGGS